VTHGEVAAQQPVLLLGRPRLAGADLALASNSAASTRTETQAEQSMQLGRYATDWLRRKPMRPKASFNSLE
jgi:hypothetical protein